MGPELIGDALATSSGSGSGWWLVAGGGRW